MKPKILMILFFIISICLQAAWVNDIPVRLTQPDGTQIDAYRSGDEFHNWVHDEKGMTIIKDDNTAYWCWAKTNNGDLVSTGYPIHLYTSESQNINPFQNISVERYNEKRAGWEVPNHQREHTRTPTTGEINNIVIFIRFSDDDEFTLAPSFYDALFNNEGQNVNSMKQYFWDASYQQLTVNSIYYPVPGNTIISYQSTNPRAYYRPYNAIDNPIGYTGGANGTERAYREHTLLQSAVNSVSSQIPTTLNIDADNDGFVDNVCFMIRGNNDEWAELLWPHR